MPPPAEEPVRRPAPLLIAAVVALLAVAVAAAIAFAILGGGPSATPSPAVSPSMASPTAAPATDPPATLLPTGTPEPTPVPTAAPPTTPTILSFDAPRRARCSDPDFPGTIRLSWEVAAADGVALSIDGTGTFREYEGTSGSDDVPFACGDEEHTYLLRTVGGSGPPDSEQVVVVRR